MARLKCITFAIFLVGILFLASQGEAKDRAYHGQSSIHAAPSRSAPYQHSGYHVQYHQRYPYYRSQPRYYRPYYPPGPRFYAPPPRPYYYYPRPYWRPFQPYWGPPWRPYCWPPGGYIVAPPGLGFYFSF
jgi:hypothetical protein